MRNRTQLEDLLYKFAKIQHAKGRLVGDDLLDLVESLDDNEKTEVKKICSDTYMRTYDPNIKDFTDDEKALYRILSEHIIYRIVKYTEE